MDGDWNGPGWWLKDSCKFAVDREAKIDRSINMRQLKFWLERLLKTSEAGLIDDIDSLSSSSSSNTIPTGCNNPWWTCVPSPAMTSGGIHRSSRWSSGRGEHGRCGATRIRRRRRALRWVAGAGRLGVTRAARGSGCADVRVLWSSM